MTRKIKQFLFSIGLWSLWQLIKYVIIIYFNCWLYSKKTWNVLFKCNFITVIYGSTQRDDIVIKKIYDKPVIYDKTLPAWFNSFENKEHFDQQLYAIKNWKLFGKYSVATEKNEILRDITWWRNYEKSTNPYSYKYLPWKTKMIKWNAIIITWNDTERNYHHWMTFWLPKLAVYQKAAITYDFIIINNEQQYHRESIKMAWIDTSKIIVPKDDSYYQFDTLYATNNPTIFGNIAPWSKEYLQTLFLGERQNTQSRKIYIKRITTRKIYNEQEFETYIQKLWFEIIVLDWLTITEQANIFSSATHVIGPHWAWFTNLLFCQSNTKIMELFHPHTCFWHYQLMCLSLWLKYKYWIHQAMPLKNCMKMDYSINVDITKLDWWLY